MELSATQHPALRDLGGGWTLLDLRRQPSWTSPSLLSRLLLTAITLLCFPFALEAAPTPTEFSPAKRDLETEARAAHKSGNWLVAVRLYDELLHSPKERPSPEAREAFQECLRRYHLQRRHADRRYHEAVAKLERKDALDILVQVLDTLSKHYFDPRKTEPGVLFHNGIQELLYALDEGVFTKEYLTTSDKKQLEPLRAKLNELKGKLVVSRAMVRDEVIPLARHVYDAGLTANLNRTTVVFALEIANGACNALDEYSLYLTPFHYNAARGKLVGVGVDLAIIGQNVEIARVHPSSPAAEAGLRPGDRVVKIDAQPVDNLPPHVVAERLLGDPDTQVELAVARGDMEVIPYKLPRRPITLSSVDARMLGGMGTDLGDIGYIQIHNFQETTPQEVKEALATLQTVGMKALILDLRGNPGGLFKAAIHVSELFLGEGGVIVITEGHLKEFNKAYKVEGGNPYAAPMVVLVDGDTASSAEILAGALKDHNRAKLFGQPTFGKGTIQQVLPLDKAAGGIRITVAKFSSPLKSPVSGIGIMPNEIVPDSQDIPFSAVQELRALLGKMPLPMPMSMPPAMPVIQMPQ
jgi:carboxyl-terminal processing protease